MSSGGLGLGCTPAALSHTGHPDQEALGLEATCASVSGPQPHPGCREQCSWVRDPQPHSQALSVVTSRLPADRGCTGARWAQATGKGWQAPFGQSLLGLEGPRCELQGAGPRGGGPQECATQGGSHRRVTTSRSWTSCRPWLPSLVPSPRPAESGAAPRGTLGADWDPQSRQAAGREARGGPDPGSEELTATASSLYRTAVRPAGL